jgi:transcriptional regulator with XRE-family HTH domain
MPFVAEKSARDGQNPKNVIAERMRLARRHQQPKVTQADLSARVEAYGVHIDRLGIGRIEAGKRIVLDFELRAIAAALYVPVSWLINEEEVWGAPQDIPERPRISAPPRVRRPEQP